jgi:hypothetical protein
MMLANSKQSLQVVLFTDGQVPDLDNTFPNIFNESTHLMVEMWIMTLSDVHSGNPQSTVDGVVNLWRKGRGKGVVHPEECYTNRW